MRKLRRLTQRFVDGSDTSEENATAFGLATGGGAGGAGAAGGAGGAGSSSNAPMSQTANCGRATPRWSVAGQRAASAASVAGLVARDRACRRRPAVGGQRPELRVGARQVARRRESAACSCSRGCARASCSVVAGAGAGAAVRRAAAEVARDDRVRRARTKHVRLGGSGMTPLKIAPPDPVGVFAAIVAFVGAHDATGCRAAAAPPLTSRLVAGERRVDERQLSACSARRPRRRRAMPVEEPVRSARLPLIVLAVIVRRGVVLDRRARPPPSAPPRCCPDIVLLVIVSTGVVLVEDPRRPPSAPFSDAVAGSSCWR